MLPSSFTPTLWVLLKKKHGLTFMTTIPFFFSKTITGSIQTYSVYYPDQLTSALMESLNPDLSESKPCAICRRLLLAADFLYERFSDCSTREKTTNSLQQLYLDIFEDPCQEISLVITMKSLSWSDLIQKPLGSKYPGQLSTYPKNYSPNGKSISPVHSTLSSDTHVNLRSTKT